MPLFYQDFIYFVYFLPYYRSPIRGGSRGNRRSLSPISRYEEHRRGPAHYDRWKLFGIWARKLGV